MRLVYVDDSGAERSGIASFSFVEVHSTSLRRADVLGGPLQV